MKQLLPALLLLVSCNTKSQWIKDSVLIEGHYRTFTFHQPEADLKGGSLLFLMHGSGGNSGDIISKTGQLEAIAGKDKLLVVYPEGYQHFWNECRKYSTATANKENINEEAFFKAMIGYFVKKYGISKENIFAAGFSGGGHMSYKLAMTMPDQIKAITAIVANMPDSASCDCTLANKALPVMIINGTDDKTNPYNGGEMFVNNSSFGVVRSSENSFAYWASLAGYRGEPVKTLLPDTDTTDHKTIESYSYKASNKPRVTLLKVVGGHHDYPGDIDVYLYAWEFFKSTMK
ncbi:PHB depolymerase family esterase [Ferruginibacter paludis]|uniref:alpha/beta hydrolase family esterase n=1 Tax=Ferruginibacter paludis TaxID=1310417 RepID=UPI0025B35946|nr:PHB depolymerase family esterase [Ferruginibacter paludis]MDN3656652.1 PHB depolymerase family esterase [Ferruginibacter paludis]